MPTPRRLRVVDSNRFDTMTIEDLIKEAEREGQMRRAVYPRSEGKPETKAHRLACMDKIQAVLLCIAARQDLRSEIESTCRLTPTQPSLL